MRFIGISSIDELIRVGSEEFKPYDFVREGLERAILRQLSCIKCVSCPSVLIEACKERLEELLRFGIVNAEMPHRRVTRTVAMSLYVDMYGKEALMELLV